MKLYAEVEEEIAIMERMQDSINSKPDNNLISFNNLLSMIEKKVNPRKNNIKLKNKNAIYRYSDDDHSYMLLDMNKKDNIFSTYLNETLTDVEMIIVRRYSNLKYFFIFLSFFIFLKDLKIFYKKRSYLTSRLISLA